MHASAGRHDIIDDARRRQPSPFTIVVIITVAVAAAAADPLLPTLATLATHDPVGR